jgi:hypothetical protein
MMRAASLVKDPFLRFVNDIPALPQQAIHCFACFALRFFSYHPENFFQALNVSLCLFDMFFESILQLFGTAGIL